MQADQHVLRSRFGRLSAKFKNLSEFIFYPEVIIYSKELGIAGSIDVLARDTKNDTYIIIDWKTSKSINKSSFGGRMGIHPITSHLMDCKYVHYSMQLSLYRYLIEEFYGIKISNLLIAHLNGNECKPIIADYYKKEVIDFCNNKNFNIIKQFDVHLLLVVVNNDTPSMCNHKSYDGIRFIGVMNNITMETNNSTNDISGMII